MEKAVMFDRKPHFLAYSKRFLKLTQFKVVARTGRLAVALVALLPPVQLRDGATEAVIMLQACKGECATDLGDPKRWTPDAPPPPPPSTSSQG